MVVLYALQTLYSADFSKGLQNVCFFFVPFTVAYGLLRDFEWDRRLLKLVLWVVAIEAVAFVLVGSVEYAHRSLFWNDQVIRSNEFHTYFRVNSVFWDPNIYGRYLALVIVVAMAALLWAKERRGFALLTALVAMLWIGLAPTFSQSSFIALLAGLAVLAALRWSLSWTLGAVALGAVGAVLRRRSGRRLRQRSTSPGSTSTPAAAPTSSPAASTSSANGRSTAMARAPSRPPTATTRERRRSRSRSPTPSRSPSPPSRG